MPKWGDVGQRVQTFELWISSEDLMCSMMTIMNNMVLYTCNLLIVDFKYSHHTHRKITMWGFRSIN